VVNIVLCKSSIDSDVKAREWVFGFAVEIGAFRWFTDAYVESVTQKRIQRKAAYHRNNKFLNLGQEANESLMG
jgi:hypothetical protein